MFDTKLRWKWILCFLLFLSSNSDLLLYAGEIKGKVTINRPPLMHSKIVSRSIIQRYINKTFNLPTNKEPRHNEHPKVVIYIDDLNVEDESTNNRIAVLDQRNEAFVPHVLPILVGTTVRFLNSDHVYHNVFSYSSTKSFDLGRYATGKYRSVKFDKPGVVKVYCDIHSHMNAFILVLETLYFTTTEREGNFIIKSVPEGIYTLKAWYGRWPEKSKVVQVKETGVTEINFEFP